MGKLGQPATRGTAKEAGPTVEDHLLATRAYHWTASRVEML